MIERVTMSDVAREAGVSLMTVSRVVNSKGEISDATRQRVLQVIERLNYRPSSIARGLATKQTGTLGLVMPDVANPFFSEIAQGVEEEAYDEGYNVFLCNTQEDVERERDHLHSLEEKRVDGLLVCSSRLDDDELAAAMAKYPMAVLINRRVEMSNVSAVMVDDEAGGRMAAEHLIAAGRRTPGYVAGPLRSRSGQLRVKGYRAALAAAGLGTDPIWAQSCAPTVEGGLEAAQALLTAHPELDALFCYNDLLAVGVLQACAELGLRVPDDLAITGFDDIPLAALVTPALTTCRVHRYELGARAMRLLLDRIAGCAPDKCKEVVLCPELIVRASAPHRM